MSDDEEKEERVHLLADLCEKRQTPALRTDVEGNPIGLGFVQPVKDGMSLNGAQMCTRQADGSYKPVALGKGPAKVVSSAYREGYDRVFGKPDARLN